MGAGISAGRHLRGIAVAWLPPVHSVAGNRLLVGGIAALGSICAIACRQYRRINLGVAICWSRRFRFLPQPLVHQVVVVGGGLPCRVGLGPILLLWHTKQRPGDEGTPTRRASKGHSAVERRGGGSRGHPPSSHPPASYVHLPLDPMLHTEHH